MAFNTWSVLMSCSLIALLAVYRYFIHGRKLKAGDIFYLGHVFVLACFLVTLYMTVSMTIKFHQHCMTFDQHRWKTDPEKRVEIVDDLIRSGLLKSKSGVEIAGLLGSPVRTYKDSTGDRLGYYLGIRNTPFQIDPEFLMVELKKGYVSRYYIKKGVPYIQ